MASNAVSVAGNVNATNALIRTQLYAEALGSNAVSVTGNVNATNALVGTQLFAEALGSNAVSVTGNVNASNALIRSQLFAESMASNGVSVTGNVNTTDAVVSNQLFAGFLESNGVSVTGRISTSNALVRTLLFAEALGSNAVSVTGNVNTTNALVSTQLFAEALGSNAVSVTGNVNTTNALIRSQLFTESLASNAVSVTGNVNTPNALVRTQLYAEALASNAVSVTGNVNTTNAFVRTQLFAESVASNGVTVVGGVSASNVTFSAASWTAESGSGSDRYGVSYANGVTRVYTAASSLASGGAVVLSTSTGASTYTDHLYLNNDGLNLNSQVNFTAGKLATWGTATTQNCMINLYGSGVTGSSTEFYGFGVNAFTLRHNAITSAAHKFYAGATELMSIAAGSVTLAANSVLSWTSTAKDRMIHLYGNLATDEWCGFGAPGDGLYTRYNVLSGGQHLFLAGSTSLASFNATRALFVPPVQSVGASNYIQVFNGGDQFVTMGMAPGPYFEIKGDANSSTRLKMTVAGYASRIQSFCDRPDLHAGAAYFNLNVQPEGGHVVVGSSGYNTLINSDRIAMTANAMLDFAGGTIKNCMINLYGAPVSSDSTEFYGFGVNGGTLRYNVSTGSQHLFVTNTTSLVSFNATRAYFTTPVHLDSGIRYLTGNPGSMIESIYGDGTNRYGVGQYAGGVTRVYAAGGLNGATVRMGFATANGDSFSDALTITNSPRTASFNVTQVSMSANSILDFGSATIKNCMINLFGTASPDVTDFFGFGINSETLRYNVPTNMYHQFYHGTTRSAYFSTTGLGLPTGKSIVFDAGHALSAGIYTAPVNTAHSFRINGTERLYIGETDTWMNSTNVRFTGSLLQMYTANSILSFGTDTIKNCMINLWGSVTPDSTEFFGFGMNLGTLRYNVSAGYTHRFYNGTDQIVNFSSTGVNMLAGKRVLFTGEHGAFVETDYLNHGGNRYGMGMYGSATTRLYASGVYAPASIRLCFATDTGDNFSNALSIINSPRTAVFDTSSVDMRTNASLRWALRADGQAITNWGGYALVGTAMTAYSTGGYSFLGRYNKGAYVQLNYAYLTFGSVPWNYSTGDAGWSCCFLVKIADPNNAQLIRSEDGSGYFNQIYVTTGGSVIWQMAQLGVAQSLAMTGSIIDTNWVFLGFVFVKESGVWYQDIYHNGVRVVRSVASFLLTSRTEPFYFGAEYENTRFTGGVSNFVAWNYAISEGEMVAAWDRCIQETWVMPGYPTLQLHASDMAAFGGVRCNDSTSNMIYDSNFGGSHIFRANAVTRMTLTPSGGLTVGGNVSVEGTRLNITTANSILDFGSATVQNCMISLYKSTPLSGGSDTEFYGLGTGSFQLRYRVPTGDYHVFYQGASVCCSLAANYFEITSANAYKPGGGTWTATSDQRLKANIEYANLETCVTIVKNLPLRRFEWKEPLASKCADKKVVGWIAQEVEQYLPKAVSTIDATQMTGLADAKFLDSDQILKTMYGALQSALQEIDVLKARVAALEA